MYNLFSDIDTCQGGTEQRHPVIFNSRSLKDYNQTSVLLKSLNIFS